MNDHPLLPTLQQQPVIATVRVNSPEAARTAVRAMAEGGILFIEITLTTPGALDVVQEFSTTPGIHIGVGSIMDIDSARRSIDAGARYLVSPHLDVEIIRIGVEAGLLVAAGAATPTEAMVGWKAGAQLAKIFPADQLGGPGYLKAVLAPMPFLRMLPTGGVTAENSMAYLKAGAFAVGLGSGLVNKTMADQGDFDGLVRLAREAVAAVKQGGG